MVDALFDSSARTYRCSEVTEHDLRVDAQVKSGYEDR